MSRDIDEGTEWADDLLGRQKNGIFLHKLVRQRMQNPQSEASALCFALDSDWGTGKTFFLKRWAEDLRGCEHPVIEFDAWANDLSEEPLIGFLAELKAGLEPLIKEVPVAHKARATANKKMGEILNQGRKAVLPAAALILKSYLSKKFDVDGVIDLVKSPEDLSIDLDVAKASIGKGLDDLFEKALKSHDETKTAVKDFKAGVADLLQYLSKHGNAALPLFIIIDELDRCRPDYAIKLLEGIKHLFDAPGICFVVSTNLHQMQESVKAVYGGGFDGYQYLKRFFAFEYRLPQPSKYAYCLSMISAFPALLSRDLVGALPNVLTAQKTPLEVAALHLSYIGDALTLSLRSLRQVTFMAEAAVAGIPKERKIYLILLFALAAILHKSPKSFDKLNGSSKVFNDILDEVAFKETPIIYHKGQYDTTPVVESLRTVLTKCYGWSNKELKEVVTAENNAGSDRYTYPSSLISTFTEEFPHSYNSNQEYWSSTRAYKELVRAAGFLQSQ